MKGGKRKGSAFEREMAKRFSLWWTNNKEDDVFWRTPISGGRGTVRINQGQSAIQVGDLQAVDARGRAFTEMVEVELKIGYPRQTPLLLLGDKRKTCIWKKWTARLIASYSRPHWLLVHQVHRGTMLLAMRKYLLESLCPDVVVIPSIFDVGDNQPTRIAVVSWAWFVKNVPPQSFKNLYERRRKGNR